MIFPTLISKKRQIFFYTFCLIVALSAFTLSPLFATDSFTSPEEGGDNNRKRSRNGNNPNDNNNNTIETEQPPQGERPSKRQKIEDADILTSVLVDEGTGMGIWVPNEVVRNIFSHTFFKDIRAGRCVAKGWQQILTDKEYVKSWGRFSPSTPEGMRATISDFIHYFKTPSFTLLRDDRFRDIEINAMSADGSALLALGLDSENNNRETAFRWRSGEIWILPSIEGAPELSWIISSDGSTLVAKDFNALSFVQWKENNLTLLPIPPICAGLKCASGFSYRASAISDDGSTIVGLAQKIANNNTVVGLKWSEDGSILLPDINNSPLISADGSTIVGMTDEGVLVQLKDDKSTELPLSEGTELTGISDDGSTIIAFGGINEGSIAWRDGEIYELPFLNGGGFSYPYDINGDGSRIVGQAYDGAENNQSTATLWTSAGAFSIQALLENAGVDLEGATLTAAEYISANGLQVVGKAIFDNDDYYFLATLPIEDPKSNSKETSN